MPEQWKPLTGLEELLPAQKPVASVPPPEQTPQFATAEYAQGSATSRCALCSSLISGQYFSVNGRMACAKCAEEARNGQPIDSHAAFGQGLLYGIGAAVLGLALYATFTIVTHFYFGYVALGVGWLVGKAIMKGSNGIGGPRYQIAAVALTYAAISLAAIPIMLARMPAGGDVDWATEAGRLAMWGLASPFLELRDPIFGLIGLVILFVGVRIAFRLTKARPLSVAGPYAAKA
jgi:hypothetical protein